MPEPKTLWPLVQWRQITSRYGGLFFRAEGGTSLSFASGVQADVSPRIQKIGYCYANSCGNTVGFSMPYSSGTQWSNWVGTGGSGGIWNAIRFETQYNEVIPKNRAIRIWERF